MVMSIVVWKCLLRTSSMARANPHMKNSDVTSMNGMTYCRATNDFVEFLIYMISFRSLIAPNDAAKVAILYKKEYLYSLIYDS